MTQIDSEYMKWRNIDSNDINLRNIDSDYLKWRNSDSRDIWWQNIGCDYIKWRNVDRNYMINATLKIQNNLF